MGPRRLSRRDILEGIVYLTGGSIFVSTRSPAQPGASPADGRGSSIDAAGRAGAAKMRVGRVGSGERSVPAAAVNSMPKTQPRRRLCATCSCEVAVSHGDYAVEAVRGIGQAAAVLLEAAPAAARQVNLRTPALNKMQATGCRLSYLARRSQSGGRALPEAYAGRDSDRRDRPVRLGVGRSHRFASDADKAVGGFDHGQRAYGRIAAQATGIHGLGEG